MLQHIVGAINTGDSPGPSRRLYREIPITAADVDNIQRRQQFSERPRPCRPTAAREQLPGITVREELFLPVSQDLLQPGVVFSHRSIRRQCRELFHEQ